MFSLKKKYFIYEHAQLYLFMARGIKIQCFFVLNGNIQIYTENLDFAYKMMCTSHTAALFKIFVGA